MVLPGLLGYSAAAAGGAQAQAATDTGSDALHILEAPVGEHQAVVYRSTAILTPGFDDGNQHDSHEWYRSSFLPYLLGWMGLPALNMRSVGLLPDPVAATDTTIRLPSVDGLRVGETLQIGTDSREGPSELMRIASIDVASGTVTVEERYQARGKGFVGPRLWPAQTEVFQHRRARPGRLPGYMVDSGVAPSFQRFRLTWEGRDVPYLALNLHFPGGDDNLKHWEDLLVYLRLRRADGAGKALEGILPMAVDDSVPFEPTGNGDVPGDPYTLREQRTRRYYGWSDYLDQNLRGATYVANANYVRRSQKFMGGPLSTFQREMVDWIFAEEGQNLARIYGSHYRYREKEVAALGETAAMASEDLVRSYQVVVDVAFLDGTDPRIDIGDFSVSTWEGADETDWGDLAVAESETLISGSVSRLDDPHDHFKFTLSKRREVHLSLTGSEGQAALILEDHARSATNESEALSTGEESIIATLDPGTYHVRVTPRSGGTVAYALRYQASVPTLWSATLTVGADPSRVPPGYGHSALGKLGGSLSKDSFTLGSQQHRVQFLLHFAGGLWLRLNQDLGSDFTLLVGDTEYAAAESHAALTGATYWWDAGDLSWAAGETIEVAIKAGDGTAPQQTQAPPTAYFTGLPQTHDGTTRFRFRLSFTENFPLSYKRLRDHSIVVEGGRLVNVRRQTRGSNLHWIITVQPTSDDNIVIRMNPGADCTASDAICTSDGRQLHNVVEVTIPGPLVPDSKDKHK